MTEKKLPKFTLAQYMSAIKRHKNTPEDLFLKDFALVACWM